MATTPIASVRLPEELHPFWSALAREIKKRPELVGQIEQLLQGGEKSGADLEKRIERLEAAKKEMDRRISALENRREEHGQDLAQRIREASIEVAGGVNRRVKLSDLREKLADVDRQSLDQALIAMARTPNASLYEMDDRASVKKADRDAAIHIGGEPRHILWIRQ